MKYELKGEQLPVVVCTLEDGETIVSEAGAMGWMSDNIEMDTNMKGGLFAGLGRAFSGDSVFLNKFTAKKESGVYCLPIFFSWQNNC